MWTGFHGIEIGEFPARIAENGAVDDGPHHEQTASAWSFGRTYARIPLKAAPHIAVGNALDMDWRELLPPEECSYIFGNPPFVGHQWRDKATTGRHGANLGNERAS